MFSDETNYYVYIIWHTVLFVFCLQIFRLGQFYDLITPASFSNPLACLCCRQAVQAVSWPGWKAQEEETELHHS